MATVLAEEGSVAAEVAVEEVVEEMEALEVPDLRMAADDKGIGGLSGN